MRRLPIFLVLDISESMAGDAIHDVQNGIKMLTDALMSDPFAMETVYVSLIAFAGKAKTIMPLTYIMDFIPPKLPIGSGTNLSEALRLLMYEIDMNVKKNTPDTKGDWRPLVFIMSDGAPNDNYTAAAAEWKTRYGKLTTVAVLMGDHSDATAFKSVTDHVLVFKDTNKESYQAFFKWVSASVQTSSKEIGEKGKEAPFDISKINIDKDLLADDLPTENSVEYFVLPVRCQNTKKPYILRYVKKDGSRQFTTDGAYPVDESYFEFSGTELDTEVSLMNLTGELPECPYCHANMIGHCHCGKWLCLSREKLFDVRCPHCGDIGDYVGGVSGVSGGRG